MPMSSAAAPIASVPIAPGGKSLFSRHYLETHLPRYPEWAEDPRPVSERVREPWLRGRMLGATWHENQTETEFLRPALEMRGDYLLALEKADAGDLADFVELMSRELIRSLALTLTAARGETLEESGGLDRRIQRLLEEMAAYEGPSDLSTV